jgi:hypothetical protein
MERRNVPLVVVEQREVANNKTASVPKQQTAVVVKSATSCNDATQKPQKQPIAPVNEVYKPAQTLPTPTNEVGKPQQAVVAVEPRLPVVQPPVVGQLVDDKTAAATDDSDTEETVATENDEEVSKLAMVISCEMSSEEEQKNDQETMLDVMRTTLERHFIVYTPDAANQRIEAEAKASGISPLDDPETYKNFKLQKQPLTLSFQVKTTLNAQADGTPVWFATVGCRALRPQLAEEILVTTLTSGERGTAPVPANTMSGREARLLAVASVSQTLITDIVARLQKWHKLNKNIYRIRFVNFNRRDRTNIESALQDLSADTRPYMRILEGSMAIQDYMDIRCKWLRKPTLLDIIQTVQEFCSVREVMVTCSMSATGLIVFEPRQTYRPTPSPAVVITPKQSDTTDETEPLVIKQPQPAVPIPGSDKTEPLVIKQPQPIVPPTDVVANWREAAVTVAVEGKGMTQQGALTAAWLNAFKRCVSENIAPNLYEAQQENIHNYLVANWHKYVVGDRRHPQIVRPYNPDTHHIIVRVQINAGLLLQDITRHFVQPYQKLQNSGVALLPMLGNDLAIEGEWLDRDAMFTTVQNELKSYTQVHNLKTIKEMMQKDGVTLGLSPEATPSDYVAAKFKDVQVLVYLSVTTMQQTDQSLQAQVWQAKISCYATEPASDRELWRFMLGSGRDARSVLSSIGQREARSQAIQNVAQKVAEKILDELKKM